MFHSLIELIIIMLAFLPLRILRIVGSCVGIIAMKFSKRAAKRLKTNLVATGICDENNVDMMARKTASEFGKTLVETVGVAWHRSKKHCASLIVDTVNYEGMEQEVLSGKPIVFLTPHMSSFEIALKFTAYKINQRVFNVLYKPSKNKWFNHIMLKGRTEDNIRPLPTNRLGVFTLAKELKANGVVGILPDSIASSGDGVWVDFFGKKVFAPTLAAKMVMMSNVVTFVVATTRIKHGFRVNYIPFIPCSGDIGEVVQQIYQVIEQIVLEAPQQYYWSYDRFRIPKHAHLIDNEGK
ncbi:MAG: hypothetical protein KBD37_07500 [Burkholderiales bacterium]|nr:hypothetical protein [Burkholderiales bacterium]